MNTTKYEIKLELQKVIKVQVNTIFTFLKSKVNNFVLYEEQIVNKGEVPIVIDFYYEPELSNKIKILISFLDIDLVFNTDANKYDEFISTFNVEFTKKLIIQNELFNKNKSSNRNTDYTKTDEIIKCLLSN